MGYLQVENEDGALKQCLVPCASLMNHSLAPHINRWGPLRPGTNSLDFIACRACQKGQELTLSYGRLSNLKLLLFYGFSMPDNLHDDLTIDFEVCKTQASRDPVPTCSV